MIHNKNSWISKVYITFVSELKARLSLINKATLAHCLHTATWYGRATKEKQWHLSEGHTVMIYNKNRGITKVYIAYVSDA